jgi:hypothetical protein
MMRWKPTRRQKSTEAAKATEATEAAGGEKLSRQPSAERPARSEKKQYCAQ